MPKQIVTRMSTWMYTSVSGEFWWLKKLTEIGCGHPCHAASQFYEVKRRISLDSVNESFCSPLPQYGKIFNPLHEWRNHLWRRSRRFPRPSLPPLTPLPHPFRFRIVSMRKNATVSIFRPRYHIHEGWSLNSHTEIIVHLIVVVEIRGCFFLFEILW